MVKKSRGKQRGIQQFSVRKHRVRLPFNAVELTPEISTYGEKLSKLTLKIWSYLSIACFRFNLLPFKGTPDGKLVLCSARRRVIHYVLAALAVAMVLRHLILSIWCLLTDGFNLNSIMCLCWLMYYSAATSGGIGSSYTTAEMMDLINSWQAQIDWIEGETGNSVSIYGKTADNIKVIWTTLIFHLIPMEFAVGSVVLADIPPTCYGFLRSLGWVSSSSVVGLVWRIFLFPLELAVGLAPGLVGAYNVGCGTLSLGLIRIYLGEMRSAFLNY